MTPDILLMRELCDEYLRIEHALRNPKLKLAEKHDLLTTLAGIRSALRKEAKALLLGQ